MFLTQDDYKPYLCLESDLYGTIDVYQKGCLYFYVSRDETLLERNVAFFSKQLYIHIEWIKKLKKIKVYICPF